MDCAAYPAGICGLDRPREYRLGVDQSLISLYTILSDGVGVATCIESRFVP